MAGMVDLLKYRDPLPERFNPYLAETVSSLPQLREIGVLDVDGKWRYSSLPETPGHSNSDRSYFIYHRDTPGSALRINEPLQSRLTGRSTIILSKRISTQDGSFAGVLTAAIDSDYFNRFYKTFQLGPDGSISLLRNDGAVLIRWPLSDRSKNLSGTDLFSRHLKLSSVGYYKIISPSTVSRNTSAMRKHRIIRRSSPWRCRKTGCWRIGGERYEPTPSLPACCCA
jgi:hypothetical protein